LPQLRCLLVVSAAPWKGPDGLNRVGT
jgi:hypothetical protein